MRACKDGVFGSVLCTVRCPVRLLRRRPARDSVARPWFRSPYLGPSTEVWLPTLPSVFVLTTRALRDPKSRRNVISADLASPCSTHDPPDLSLLPFSLLWALSSCDCKANVHVHSQAPEAWSSRPSARTRTSQYITHLPSMEMTRRHFTVTIPHPLDGVELSILASTITSQTLGSLSSYCSPPLPRSFVSVRVRLRGRVQTPLHAPSV